MKLERLIILIRLLFTTSRTQSVLDVAATTNAKFEMKEGQVCSQTQDVD